MNLPTVEWRNSGITPAQMRDLHLRFAPELSRLKRAAGAMYEDDHASINLPLDRKHLTQSVTLAKKHKKARLIVVIGIGGSNLGTIAVQEALLGKLHNLTTSPTRSPHILYADTVDPDQMASIASLVDAQLRQGHHVVINAISKSGATTETIANLEILLAVLRARKRDATKHVVITTDEGSPLWSLAKDEGFSTLPIPKKVGGRYSVLSPVGLFPLALLGVDVNALLDGAAHMRAACLSDPLHGENPAMVRAALLAHAHAQGRNIADNFYFKTDLESIGKWYRQLMGESIGKEWDASHTKRVWMGITPTVSVGSTDLHSMAQLYFGGPSDKLHTIVSVKRWASQTAVPRIDTYDRLVPHIQGKPLAQIMDAVHQGVTSVLATQHRPYCEITLPACDAHTIGALLQLHMMEMMYLAAVLGVNPFDQPNVEAYKTETRKALAKE